MSHRPLLPPSRVPRRSSPRRKLALPSLPAQHLSVLVTTSVTLSRSDLSRTRTLQRRKKSRRTNTPVLPMPSDCNEVYRLPSQSTSEPSASALTATSPSLPLLTPAHLVSPRPSRSRRPRLSPSPSHRPSTLPRPNVVTPRPSLRPSASLAKRSLPRPRKRLAPQYSRLSLLLPVSLSPLAWRSIADSLSQGCQLHCHSHQVPQVKERCLRPCTPVDSVAWLIVLLIELSRAVCSRLSRNWTLSHIQVALYGQFYE
jgi:hypothetical protein